MDDKGGASVLMVEFCVAIVPVIAIIFLMLPIALETRDLNLYDNDDDGNSNNSNNETTTLESRN